jgi:D-lactate dehydrogenase
MAVGHITYDPSGVAEFTVMDILMAVRRINEIHEKTLEGDFRLKGMIARQLKDLSIGIVGVGQIGLSVLRDLSGFGCKLYYSNRSDKPEADKYAERLDLDDLLKTCDVVSIHLEYNSLTHHLFNAETIAKMKEGAILVNTSRGGLIDTEALIDALESGHLASAALDVVENEFDLLYYDCRDKDLNKYYVGKLRHMPNVIYTHHMAYYYREAVWGMVYNSILSMKQFDEGEEVPLRLI